MQGIVIIDKDHEPDNISRIHQYALENGLIMITAGTDGNVIKYIDAFDHKG